MFVERVCEPKRNSMFVAITVIHQLQLWCVGSNYALKIVKNLFLQIIALYGHQNVKYIINVSRVLVLPRYYLNFHPIIEMLRNSYKLCLKRNEMEILLQFDVTPYYTYKV